jgi:serine/threonine protein kinase
VAGYLLEKQIGQGGMAVVFRARDERLGRLVALKVLAPALAADQAFRQRFIRESRAAAAVDDPHIIPVYDAGESGGVLFIAMRFVRGGDVRSLLRSQGRLPAARAAALISAVASALDAAHAAGLVHRDVKPANMLLDVRQGRADHVYLSDFGLGKQAPSVDGLTGSGQFLGTPGYAPPEQIRGQPVDGRADQYALACTAFELLAGKLPFHPDQGLAVIGAHLSRQPPPLSKAGPGLPAAADPVIARALAKTPAQRYPSCQHFADALARALGQPASTQPAARLAPHTLRLPRPHPTSRPATLRLVLIGGVSAVVLSGILLAVVLAASASRLPGHHHPAAYALIRTLTPPGSDSVDIQGVAFSRSGQTLATAEGSGTFYVWNVARGRVTLTLADPGSLYINAVAFSADGNTLATADGNGSTYLWDAATGGQVGTLTDPRSQGVSQAVFSPDGRTLAAADGNGSTYLWNVAARRRIATLTDPRSKGVTAVAFSPDGGTLITGDGNGNIYLWDVATGRLKATWTIPQSAGITSVAFSPGGETVAAGDEGGSTLLWNASTGRQINALPDPSGQTVNAVAFSPGGRTLAAADDGGTTYLWNPATGARIAKLSDPDPYGSPVNAVAFNPAGTVLATGDDDGSIYLWNTGRT